jgi:uncharacterized membrane protein YgcG
MKFKKTLLLAIGGVFVWWAWKAPAQDTTGTAASQPMPYAVSQVLELEQAKIGDSTVIAYIKTSGTSYNLNASQIVFLRQQGVSDGVITAMLTQPRMADSVPYAQTPGPEPQAAPVTTMATATTPAPAIVTQPPVTYVQSAPVSYDDSYAYPNSYPYYGYYGWPYSWTWYGGAWRWGWRGGGGSVGWHGGWGWHGGGWGGHVGWGGGGFHGGGGHR